MKKVNVLFVCMGNNVSESLQAFIRDGCSLIHIKMGASSGTLPETANT